MLKKVFCCTLLMAFCATPVWAKNDTLLRAQKLFKPIPTEAPSVKGVKATPALVELGKMLYFDPRLSTSYLISCNTCHNVGLGGVDLQETSIGHRWQKGPRNAPTVLNAVFNIAQFWDGRAEDLAKQAKGPMQAMVEMGNNPVHLIATLKSIPGYSAFFSKAFPVEKEPITFDNVATAIEMFEVTLITPGAPFDLYLAGNTKALSPTQVEGLKMFIDKGCVACHSGVNVGGSGYFPFGVVKAPGADIRPTGDLGRFKVTKTKSDKYVFKSPSLRNIELTRPYFHSGKVWKLKDAVAIMESAQLGAILTPGETERIVSFLKTLTGRQPKVEYPILPPDSDATPHPTIK